MTKERMLEIIHDCIDIIRGAFFDSEIKNVLVNDLKLTEEEIDILGIGLEEEN